MTIKDLEILRASMLAKAITLSSLSESQDADKNYMLRAQIISDMCDVMDIAIQQLRNGEDQK